MGHHCDVIAPTLIPKRKGDKIKTDRRDSQRLAELHRARELTPVWVPDETQKAIRDLVRARDNFKTLERQQRQKLTAFLLRHGKTWTRGKKNWTKGYWLWLESLKMENPHQQFVLREYMDGVRRGAEQVRDMEKETERAKSGWSLEPIVDGLMAMRGIRLVVAMEVISELGDLSRFSKPTELMGYLGLIPSEHSSGESRRQGASAAPQAVQDIAWKAQKRLCGRYR